MEEFCHSFCISGQGCPDRHRAAEQPPSTAAKNRCQPDPGQLPQRSQAVNCQQVGRIQEFSTLRSIMGQWTVADWKPSQFGPRTDLTITMEYS